jgi:hypothetical protein
MYWNIGNYYWRNNNCTRADCRKKSLIQKIMEAIVFFILVGVIVVVDGTLMLRHERMLDDQESKKH